MADSTEEGKRLCMLLTNLRDDLDDLIGHLEAGSFETRLLGSVARQRLSEVLNSDALVFDPNVTFSEPRLIPLAAIKMNDEQ